MRRVAAAAVVLAAVGLAACGEPEVVVTAEAQAKAVAEVAVYVDLGTVARLDCSQQRALIVPAAWGRLNADGKERLGLLVADACGVRRVMLVDDRSGRDLARYGRTTGFEVY